MAKIRMKVQNKISVLHIVLSTVTGGMENVIYNLAVSRNHEMIDIKVGCLEQVGALSEKLRQEGVESHLIPKMISGLSLIYPRTLIEFIRESNCDIVHTHSGCWNKVASACMHLPHVKLVYTEHGRIYPDPRLALVLDKFAGFSTDKIVAVGKALELYLVDKVGLPPVKVITIRNGVDTERFKPSEKNRIDVRRELGYSDENIVIGIVARLAKVKNHRYLLEVFKIVLDICPQARLLIIGDGNLRPDLENISKAYNIANEIQFLGDRSDVPQLLSGLDISTLCSFSEGISLTILEAMSCKLPVVATNIGGNPSIISNGSNGFLVEIDHAKDYAEKLIALIKSRELRITMGERSRSEIVSNWSINVMADSYQKLYEELLSVR